MARGAHTNAAFHLGAALIAAMCWPLPAAAQPAQNFYAGKQLMLIGGAAVGGGYDALARLLARHLGRHIPGNPTVVVQNQPAAGSLVTANAIYNTAPKDGTVIALIQRGMLTARLINPGQVRFRSEAQLDRKYRERGRRRLRLAHGAA
jgi:tripartite-type tricarboxylate transporter receptor subunit TctC